MDCARFVKHVVGVNTKNLQMKCWHLPKKNDENLSGCVRAFYGDLKSLALLNNATMKFSIAKGASARFVAVVNRVDVAIGQLTMTMGVARKMAGHAVSVCGELSVQVAMLCLEMPAIAYVFCCAL